MGGRLPILLFHSVRVLASLVWEGVRWLAMVRVLMRRWVLHHAGLVWMLLDIWALLIEVRGTLRICLILPYTLTRWRLLKSWLSFLVIFNISLIAFFNSIWSIYLVDFNVFISKSLTTRFGVDFKMIGVLHILRWSTVVLATRVKPTQLLLCFLLMEDIQVRAMRSLNSNDQTLIVRNPILRVPRATIVPNWQVFKILVRHICIVSVLRVRENLFLLFFEICDQIIQLIFHLTQLFFVFENFKISISQFRINIFQRICGGITAT